MDRMILSISSKVSVLLNLVYRLNAIPIKFPMSNFGNNNKMIVKMCGETKDPK